MYLTLCNTSVVLCWSFTIMFSVLSVFEIASKAITNPPFSHYKTSKLTDYSLLLSNLLIIDRPHWKYWINYYHLSSIINKRQLEWIGSLFIDDNPQRFVGIEVIPAISSQLRWSRNKTERTWRLYVLRWWQKEWTWWWDDSAWTTCPPWPWHNNDSKIDCWRTSIEEVSEHL